MSATGVRRSGWPPRSRTCAGRCASRRPSPRRPGRTRPRSEELPQIVAPFADARASDLSLRLGEAPKPALASLRRELDGLEVELRVLGCSHQVVVRGEETELSEVVACLPGPRGELPDRLIRRVAGANYAFASRTLALDGPRFERRAEATRALVGSDDRGLVGIFPGLANAFTALRCGLSGATVWWESWHSYPQTGEMVHTAGRVHRRTAEPTAPTAPRAASPER